MTTLHTLPQTLDLGIIQGQSYGPHQLTITNPGTPATPVDLTGATFEAHIRRRASDTALLTAFVIAVTDAANGVLTLSLPADLTALLPATEDPTSAASRCVWDLRMIDSLGRRIILCRGTITGYLAVTRP